MATIRELQARFTAQADGLRNTMRTMAKDVKAFGKDSQKSVQQTNTEYRKLEQTLGGLQDEIKQTKQQMGQGWDDSELKELERAIQKVKDELRTTGTVGEESMEDFRRVLRESRTDLANLGEGNPFSNLVAQIEITESSVQALNQLELNNLQREFDQVAQNVNESNSNIDTFRTNLNTLEDALRTSTNVQGFEELNRTLQDVQEELRTTGRVSVENMDALNRALGVSQTEINQLGNASGFQDLIQQINQVQASMQTMGNQGATELQQIETAAQQTQQELNQLDSIQLDGLQAEMDDVVDSTVETGDAAQGSEGSFVGAMGAMKGSVLALAAAVTGAVASVWGFLKLSDDLQKALNSLQTQTGSTVDEMEGMEASLLNIYRNNYGESLEDIANSMALVKQVTGQTGDALEDTTTKAILLRDSFGFEVNESLKVTKVMMDQFGISADEAFTLLAQGQQKGLNYADDMMDSFWEYSVYFKQLGFDAEGMWDVFKAGADGGAFNIDKIGDSIKELGIRVKDGSKTSVEAFQALGMNADGMMKMFAKGGDSAQEALAAVFQKLGEIEDPIKRNAIGVNLFGTQFEDLEHKTILALGNVRGQADMTANTLEEIDKVKYNSIGEAIVGIGRLIYADMINPLQQKVMPSINNFVNKTKELFTGLGQLAKGDSIGFINTITDAFSKDKEMRIINFFLAIRDGIQRAKEFIAPFKTAIEGVFALFKSDDSTEGTNILAKLGLNYQQIIMINTIVETIKQTFKGLVAAVKSNFENMKTSITALFNFLAPYIMPLLQSIVSFIGEKVAQITKFWDENGKQITDAAKNAFNLILGIIKFVMPAVLAIITMVWNNIKGVINGALNIIMGAIKVFAGLFTGDFKKMWEGIKQMFKGAIEFVWNLISLMMFGKILSGIKSFITSGISAFRGFIDDIVNFFRNLDSRVTGIVGKFVNYLKNSWTSARNSASTIFTNMKNTIGKIWDDIVDGAKALPGRIGTGIKNMAGKAAEGVKTLANNLMSNLGLGVNGVIGGVNWILGKVGVDKKVPKWEVPQYAKGTEGHKGGPMIIGDGGQQELVRYPDGTMYLSPDKNTLVPDAPRGTTVLSGGETKKLLSMGIPGYAKGIGDFFSFIGKKVSSGANYVKEKALDVWDMVSDPAKMLKKVLEDRGFSFSLPGVFKDAAGGILNKITSGAVGFIKEKLEGLGSIGGSFKGGVAAPAQVKSWVTQALNMTNTPLSWLPAMLVKAQKESGFNPRAINLWDINAKRGIPSKGLFQTIDPTFNAYKMSGMNDIYNPIHNAVAAIRYIKARYGDVFNTPGIKSMARGGGYKGYFEGARVAAKQLAWIAERGAEYVIPTDGGQRAYELWNQAGQENGFIEGQGNSGYADMTGLVESIRDLALRPVSVKLGEKEVAKAIHHEVSKYQAFEKSRSKNFGKGV